MLHIFSMLDYVESERGGAQTHDRDPRVILSLSVSVGLVCLTRMDQLHLDSQSANIETLQRQTS